jgi:hypothetical protein
MGADSPQPPIPSPDPKTKSTFPFVLAGVLFLIVCALEWHDVVEYIDGEPRVTVKHQQRLEEKLAELEEGEQYVLIARKDGFYPCVHNGYPLYFLHVGEVWRYGTTIKGQRGRYTSQFMKENTLSYIIQFRGTVGECLQHEQIKLFHYPLLPENLARPKEMRLLLPPYNPVYK